MKRLLIVAVIVIASACAIKKVESSKALHDRAREAQESGNDLEAAVLWKAIVEQTGAELKAGHYSQTNRFLRASALLELGEWDRAFTELKEIEPAELRKEEFWIYPLYSVMMGDYYANQNLHSVAANFYQSVLKESSLKSSEIYLLALERSINNSISKIQRVQGKEDDQKKARVKEYEALSKQVEKYIEEYPHAAIPHLLYGDLQLKLGKAEEALEHLIAAIELNLPTSDLKKTAEFEIAGILTDYEVSTDLKSLLLRKAPQWWNGNSSLLRSGSATAEWMNQHEFVHQNDKPENAAGQLRYLAIANGNTLKILLWEKE